MDIFRPTNITIWENFHFTTKTIIKDLFTVRNPRGRKKIDQYNEMTTLLQGFITRRQYSNEPFKPFGSGWSWTGVNTSEGGVMLDTSSNKNKGLNLIMDLEPGSVSNQYTGDPKFLVMCQCGAGVRKLNKYLEGTKRSLKTSGASDGQTIVGAMSTGTHGSNPIEGAIHNYVVGMHIITGPGVADQCWVERKSYPVVSSAFLNSLNLSLAQLKQDDDLFNSALVNIGGLGVLHAVLLETVEIYQLRLIRQKFPYDDKLVKLMTTLDAQAFGFPDYQGEPLSHLQVVFNPYKFDVTNKTGEAIVTYGYKLPSYSSLSGKKSSWFQKLLMMLGFKYYKFKNFISRLISDLSNDLVRFLAKLDDTMPELIPDTVEAVLKLSYKTGVQQGVLGDLFTGEGPPSALAGSTMFVGVNDIEKVLEIFQRRTPKASPEFSGIYSLRFVKSSSATLGGNYFGNVTCAIEADGILNDRTKRYYANIWNDLRTQNIPFRFHLGKLNDLDQQKFSAMYGPSKTVWLNSQNALLNPSMKSLLMNDTLRGWGLV
ncbi:hypothetical protein WSM22_39820 [Cytophagales bacterium WSM2-2]|nr:hypothetical protein WSM22_39820 [Cytophagales bacterium WSM2-2]